MASISLPRTHETASSKTLTMPEAAELLSHEEQFMAVVQAMNTLLIAKGVYSQEEFNALYVMWAKNQQRRPKKLRPGWRARLLSILTSGS
jgi:hypothetical protein